MPARGRGEGGFNATGTAPIFHFGSYNALIISESLASMIYVALLALMGSEPDARPHPSPPRSLRPSLPPSLRPRALISPFLPCLPSPSAVRSPQDSRLTHTRTSPFIGRAHEPVQMQDATRISLPGVRRYRYGILVDETTLPLSPLKQPF